MSSILGTYARKPISFKEGEGSYLIAENGEKYLDFVLLLMIGTGLSFQIPILQLFLGLLGVIKWQEMLSAWRWVVIASAIAGAVITPSTDPITMMLLASSISVLFLLGVLLVAIADKFKEQIPPASNPPSNAG